MISFLSGDKKVKIVSATANKLLIVNEAQDITPAKFDKDISPMGAYSNVTRLIGGTVWTSHTFWIFSFFMANLSSLYTPYMWLKELNCQTLNMSFAINKPQRKENIRIVVMERRWKAAQDMVWNLMLGIEIVFFSANGKL